MLTLYRPNRSIVRRPGLFGNVFDDVFMSAWDRGLLKQENAHPAVDLVERDNAYEIHADLPGIAEKDVAVTLSDGVLSINAKRESTEHEDRDEFRMRERYQGSYLRRFRLGSQVDSEKIEASYNNGVLKVVVPKAAEVQPRQIPVN